MLDDEFNEFTPSEEWSPDHPSSKRRKKFHKKNRFFSRPAVMIVAILLLAVLLTVIILLLTGAFRREDDSTTPEESCSTDLSNVSDESDSDESSSDESSSESSDESSSEEPSTEETEPTTHAAPHSWSEPSAAPEPVQAGITIPSWIQQELLTLDSVSRPGTKMESVNWVVIHYVGNANTAAHNNRDYFQSLTDKGVSSHFIVGMDGEILQCVPIDEVAYAQGLKKGHPYNSDSVSIENCHPDATGEFLPATRDSLVKLTAWLLEELDLTTDCLLRHYDVQYQVSGDWRYSKACPRAWTPFRGSTPTDTEFTYNEEGEMEWQRFKDDVAAYTAAHPDIANEFQ